MGIEVWQNDFYFTDFGMYIILRYMLIIMTYFMFAKDYVSVAQFIMI